MFSLTRVAEIVAGELLRDSPARVGRPTHDSRLVQPGDLFVALQGANVDGHQYLEDAFARGASGALIRDASNLPENARNLIRVPDPLQALQTWASAWRDSLHAKLVAITGTNGKTTVKGLLSTLLQGTYPTFTAPGNYNTEIGLPLALLAMPENARIGVFELGAEQPGDIACLSNILKPDLAILTSIGSGHLETLGSIEAVAREKWSLVSSLHDDAVCYFNAEAAYLSEFAESTAIQCIPVGPEGGSHGYEVDAAVPQLSVRMPSIPLCLSTQLIGAHNATNVALAASVALALGVEPAEIEHRASTFEPQPQRLRAIQLPLGTLLDDSYNSNPNSAAAALRVLEAYPPATAHRVFVFGDMLGLGQDAPAFHTEIAQLAGKLGIHAIIPVGAQATAACAALTELEAIRLPRDAIPGYLLRRAKECAVPSVILVKGSRDVGLEQLIEKLDPATRP